MAKTKIEIELDNDETLFILHADGSVKETRMPMDEELTRGLQIAYTLLLASPPKPSAKSRRLNAKLTELIEYAETEFDILSEREDDSIPELGDE